MDSQRSPRGFAPATTSGSTRRQALALTAEDRSEEDGPDPLERVTCRTHRRRPHGCVSSPLHVVIVTGTRWCRQCECAPSVAIDRPAGDVAVHCSSGGETPATRASRQLVRACRAGLATAADR